MSKTVLLNKPSWLCYLKLINDFSIRFTSSVTSGSYISQSLITLWFYNLIFVVLEFCFMDSTTIIFGSLRFTAGLPFSEYGNLFSKNTPGIFFNGCCPFISLYWVFVLPTSQIYLHLSDVYLTTPCHFHFALPLSWCIFIIKYIADFFFFNLI